MPYEQIADKMIQLRKRTLGGKGSALGTFPRFSAVEVSAT